VGLTQPIGKTRKTLFQLGTVMAVGLVLFLLILPFHLVVKKLIPGPVGTYWKEMLLGLLVGTGIGYGLAYVMRPFLSLTLAASLEGHAIDRVIVHWPTVARLYAVLAGFYALALLLLLAGLVRSALRRPLRMGDE